MNLQSYYHKDVRFSVKRLRDCKWPWIWKINNGQMSGRCYRTIKLAKEAAERWIDSSESKGEAA